MALGKKNYVNDGKFYILRLVNKQKDPTTGKDVPLEPNQFLVNERLGEKQYSVIGHEKAVNGDLVQIKLEKDEYEGKPYDKVRLTLKDESNKETYLLDLRMTQLTRNLFNSLLALTSFKGLSISTYLKEGKDGKKYSNISLWQNNELVKGKFAWEEWPKVEELKNSKGIVQSRDFTAVDDFFVSHLSELAKKVNKAEKPAQPAKDNTAEVPAATVDDSEIPF